MKDEMIWKEINWMKKDLMNDFLLSISFSIFGMLLIFGLGFVFPEINPYVVIKWIIIVCAAVFAYSLISFFMLRVMRIRIGMLMKDVWKIKKTSKK
jgi:hypothetical protein